MRHEHAVPGVVGRVGAARAFTEEWTRRTGAAVQVSRSDRMYCLTEVTPPVDVPGSARLAAETDIDLLARWMADFAAEADPGERDAEAATRRKLTHGLMAVWEDGGAPVSMAGAIRPVAGISRIAPVYTPPEHRRHGYGSAVTAAVTQACLGAGAGQCMLYTDLANPTSNAIYQSIGYRPVADGVKYTFTV